jgi:hypothetical protein
VSPRPRPPPRCRTGLHRLTHTQCVRVVGILRDNPRSHSFLVVPPRVVQAARRLPRPEDPALDLLVRHDLRGPPLLVPVNVGVRIPVARPLDVICDAEGPFAHDHGRIATPVVIARVREVGRFGFCHAGVLDVIVVIVGGESEIGEILFWVARVPFLVHHLDVELVVPGYSQFGLLSPYARPCRWVVGLQQGIS